MVTLASPTPPTGDAAHRHPEIAQSFGSDAGTYDRARPRYPAALVDAVVERLAGCSILDVGIGTGIAAEPFRDRGFAVLGVEPDPKMAAAARAKGFVVEAGRFEDWDPAGRTFDGVIAGQTWHSGSNRTPARRRPRARCTPAAARALLEHGRSGAGDRRRVRGDLASLDIGLPFNPWAATPHADPYGAIIDRAVAGLHATGSFGVAERLAFEGSRQRDATPARADRPPAASTASEGHARRAPRRDGNGHRRRRRQPRDRPHDDRGDRRAAARVSHMAPDPDRAGAVGCIQAVRRRAGSCGARRRSAARWIAGGS